MKIRHLALLFALAASGATATATASAAGTARTGAQTFNLDAALKNPGKPEQKLSGVRRQALLYKGASAVRGRLPGAITAGKLDRLEVAKWKGQKITRLSDPQVGDPTDFRAEKASMLLRLGLEPDDVTEGFIDVGRSTVSGRSIDPRRIFVRTFRATGANRRDETYVPSPGFLESSSDYEEVVRQKLAEGYDVTTMDHQWAGYTGKAGKPGAANPGGVDSAFGIGRDVAAVIAYASRGGQKVQVAAISMGGLGVLAAVDAAQRKGGLVLNLERGPNGEDLRGTKLDLGKLAGPPQIIGGFAGTSRTLLTRGARLGARIPLARDLALPATGIIPKLSSDAHAQTGHARNAARGDYRAKLSAMVQVDADQAEIIASLGSRPLTVPLAFVHDRRDPLASPAAIGGLVDRLNAAGGAPVTSRWLATGNHVYASSPFERPQAFAPAPAR